MLSYRIMNLTTIAESMQITDVDMPVTEMYEGGVYARTISMPRDSFIVGALHKKDNLNVLTEGRLLLQIVSSDGASETKEVTAPYFYRSKAETMKVAIVLDDAVWTSFSDSDIESENVYTDEESTDFYLTHKDKICLSQ